MQRGQFFSLDFLISLILLFLAIGILFRASELSLYDQKDERLFAELKNVSENAGNMLVANPNINCLLEKIEIKLMNCIDTFTTSTFTADQSREALGIEQKYGFEIIGIAMQGEGTLDEKKDFTETTRLVLVHDEAILTKGDYTDPGSDFRTQSDALSPLGTEVTIRVWLE